MPPRPTTRSTAPAPSTTFLVRPYTAAQLHKFYVSEAGGYEDRLTTDVFHIDPSAAPNAVYAMTQLATPTPVCAAASLKAVRPMWDESGTEEREEDAEEGEKGMSRKIRVVGQRVLWKKKQEEKKGKGKRARSESLEPAGARKRQKTITTRRLAAPKKTFSLAGKTAPQLQTSRPLRRSARLASRTGNTTAHTTPATSPPSTPPHPIHRTPFVPESPPRKAPAAPSPPVRVPPKRRSARHQNNEACIVPLAADTPKTHLSKEVVGSPIWNLIREECVPFVHEKERKRERVVAREKEVKAKGAREEKDWGWTEWARGRGLDRDWRGEEDVVMEEDGGEMGGESEDEESEDESEDEESEDVEMREEEEESNVGDETEDSEEDDDRIL